MKRFEFRLDKVLDYKRKIEDVNKQELAKAKCSLLEAEKKKSALKAHQVQQLEEMSRILQNLSVGEVHSLLLYDQYLLRVSNNIEKAEEELIHKTIEVEQKRDKLVESSKGRRIVEKLRDKRKEDFSFERRKWEQSLDDECAKHRHLKGKDQPSPLRILLPRKVEFKGQEK